MPSFQSASSSPAALLSSPTSFLNDSKSRISCSSKVAFIRTLYSCVSSSLMLAKSARLSSPVRLSTRIFIAARFPDSVRASVSIAFSNMEAVMDCPSMKLVSLSAESISPASSSHPSELSGTERSSSLATCFSTSSLMPLFSLIRAMPTTRRVELVAIRSCSPRASASGPAVA